MNLYGFASESILMEEAEIMRKIETNQLKRQTEILSTFVPDAVINTKLTELHEAQNFVAVVLLGDISGVSLMSEKYTKAGNGSINSLSATLNLFYGCIIEVLRFYGGDILKFSSDAFLAMWRTDPDVCLYTIIHDAVVASLFLQQDLSKLLVEENIHFKLKLTIASGDVTFVVIGDEEFKDFVVTGPVIDDLGEVRRSSLNGDVAVALSAWGHIAEDNYEITNGCTGCVKVLRCVYQSGQESRKDYDQERRFIILALCQLHFKYRKSITENDKFLSDKEAQLQFLKLLPHRSEVSNASRRWSVSDLRSFIPKFVLEHLDIYQLLEDITEIRDVNIQLTSILLKENTKTNLISTLTNIYENVCEIVNNFSGAVNGFWFLSNQIKIAAVFGLRYTRPDVESQNAVRSAYQLRKNILVLNSVKNVSISVTRGLVYCGIVGHPFRKCLLVTGATVNKAMRIARAFPRKVTCDHHTYRDCKLSSSYFQPLRSEATDFGVVLEYNEDFKEKVVLQKPLTPLLGREIEVELVRLILKPPDSNQTYRGICFHGNSKIGKTRLLYETVGICLDNRHSVACINLCGRVQRPYFCVSLLYKQLYDSVTKSERQEIRFDLPRELWDLNEALQVGDNIDRKGTITKMLLEMCASINTLTVFIIDNVQYIDSQSYEVIIAALKHKHIRFICGGQFEEDTWDVRWKMSLNKDIKVLELRALSSGYFSPLFCNFLSVKGVDKKLIKLFENNDKANPGLLKTRLDAFQRSNYIEIKRVLPNEFAEHRFVFPDEKLSPTNAIPVAKLTAQNAIMDGDVTSSRITKELYNSFTSYQQMVVRAAAVIGEVFNRKLLLAILSHQKENLFVEVIEQLFEKDVFDCATRYMTYGGLVDNLRECYCFSVERNRQIEKCAYCKLIYFKDRTMRVEVYNLLLTSEKKELHLKVAEFLESEDNSCSKCAKGACVPIISRDTFKSFVQCSEDLNETVMPNDVDDGSKHRHVLDDYKEGHNLEQSRISLKAAYCFWKRGELHICFCIEMLIKVYSELIYHCEIGDHLGKHIFFIMQYASILMLLGENKEAAKHLSDALEFCVLAKKENTTLDSTLKKSLCARIHLLIAEAYVKMGNTDAAKKHVVSSLMQNSIHMPILSRMTLFVKAIDVFPSKPDVVMCVSLLSRIFAAEDQWHIAKAASLKSLKMLKGNSFDIKIVCEAYKTAMKIFNSCKDNYISKKLEKRARKEVFRKFVGNFLVDFFAISDFMHSIFKLEIIKGNLITCVKLGLRTLELNQYLQTSFAVLELIPTLATLLLFARRIEDAVTVIKILKHQINVRESIIAYFAFCVELNNETSLILEPMDTCLKVASNYLHQNTELTFLDTKLALNIYNYLLRNRRWHQAMKWSIFIKGDAVDLTSFISIWNIIKETECSLLLLVHEMEMKKNFVYAEEEKVIRMLKGCEKAASQWKMFLPRVLHLKAYFCQLMAYNTKVKRLLKQANEIAKRQENNLECCWIKLNESVWNGGFSFGTDMKNIDWKLEKRYTTEQWSQILFSLPLSAN